MLTDIQTKVGAMIDVNVNTMEFGEKDMSLLLRDIESVDVQ